MKKCLDFIKMFSLVFTMIFIIISIGILLIVWFGGLLSLPLILSMKYSIWYILLYLLTIPLFMSTIELSEGIVSDGDSEKIIDNSEVESSCHN